MFWIVCSCGGLLCYVYGEMYVVGVVLVVVLYIVEDCEGFLWMVIDGEGVSWLCVKIYCVYDVLLGFVENIVSVLFEDCVG